MLVGKEESSEVRWKSLLRFLYYNYNCTISQTSLFLFISFHIIITLNSQFSISLSRCLRAGAKTQPSERWWWRWRGTKRSKNGASILHRLSRSVAKVPRGGGGGRCRGETSLGEKMRNVAGGPGLMDILTYTPDYLPPHAALGRLRNRSYACCHGFTPIITSIVSASFTPHFDKRRWFPCSYNLSFSRLRRSWIFLVFESSIDLEFNFYIIYTDNALDFGI